MSQDEKKVIIPESEIVAYRQKIRRPKWEYWIVAVIVVLAAGYISFAVHAEVNHIRAAFTRQQLLELRSAMIMYYVNERSFPPNLATLVKTPSKDAKTGNLIYLLENLKLDDEGRPIDPMGHLYLYDNSSGKVSSVSPCCKNW